MKEPDYVMKMMACGGLLQAFDNCKEAVCCWIEDSIECVRQFHYTCPFDRHFCYKHAVNDHNNPCHMLLSIEDSWATQRWEVWVFAFVLAITKINAFLKVRYFHFTMPALEKLILHAQLF